MNSSEKGILIAVLVLAGMIYLLPLIAGLYYERQDRKKRGEPDNAKAQYDERQKLIRLRANTHAFYALVGYLAVWLVMEFMDAPRWEGRTVHLLWCGLILALTVGRGECILRGAMLGYNQRKAENGQIALHFTAGTCWMVTGGMNLNTSAMSGSLGVMQMLLGGSYCILGALMLYARRSRRLAELCLDAGDGDE